LILGPTSPDPGELIKESRRKEAIIVSQADQIADLRDKQVKVVSKRRRPPYETKIRPLTKRQTEAMQIVPECKLNFAEAGRRMKLDPKTVRQHYFAGLEKLGPDAVRAARAARQKAKTRPLPEDRRGQTDLYGDANGEVRQGRHIDRRRRSGKRHDQG